MSGMFAQFAQAAAAQGTFNADIARHLAVWTAAGGAVEPNLEPLVRIQVEQAGASVGPLVEELTGLLLHQPGEKLIVTAATKAEWAADSLTAWRPFFDGFAAGVGAMFDGTGLLDSDGDHDDDEMPEQLRALGLGALPGGLSGLAKMMGPTLVEQDKNEAVATIKKRMDFIRAEVTKAERLGGEAKKKVEVGKEKMAGIKARAEAMAAAAAAAQ